jgi:RimJ/RimL family protein N-acetyltransferase
MSIELTKMTPADFADYFALKSDPDDVLWSGFAKPPVEGPFREWFLGAIKDPGRTMYIARENGIAVGYLTYRGDDVSAGVKRGCRNKGYGIAMLRQGGGIAWVATDNIPSIKMVEAAGFRDTGITREQEFLLPKPHKKTMRRYASATYD